MKLQINMVVKNAKESADYYKTLFGADIISQTDLEESLNETMMSIGNTERKVLNENRDYGLIATSEDSVSSMWINLYVEDINKQIQLAEDAECIIISPVTEFPENKAINAVFRDKYGHVWVINQIMN